MTMASAGSRAMRSRLRMPAVSAVPGQGHQQDLGAGQYLVQLRDGQHLVVEILPGLAAAAQADDVADAHAPHPLGHIVANVAGAPEW